MFIPLSKRGAQLAFSGLAEDAEIYPCNVLSSCSLLASVVVDLEGIN